MRFTKHRHMPENGNTMTTPTTLTTTPDWFEDFRSRITRSLSSAVESIQAAAAIYCEAIDRDPTFKDYLSESCPEVSGGLWRNLEMVGRGQLDARIAAGGCPYGNKLRRVPVSEQKLALDGTVPFLTASGDTLNLRLDSMLPSQAEQVFGVGRIRSLADQKAWQEAKALEVKRTTKAQAAPSVEIDKKRRRILVNGYPITAADLADYLRKISD